jgi:prepilin-type N-terminal cleavage/methylation domain-containing protein
MGFKRGARSSLRPEASLRSGFTLLEILVAVAVFGITMAALTTTQVSTVALSRTNLETSAALDAAQDVLESIEGEDDFTQIFARWKSGGTGPGNVFDVRGLEPTQDDPDGRVGEVVFPGDGTQLLENGNDRALGLPRDLDLDTFIDGTDHALDYRILPVLVRVRWSGPGGVHQIEIVGTVTRR